ncbi:MAG: OmpA family protein [Bergeyella sp.]
MKKIFLALAVAGLVISCKKISQGGNHGVIKIEGDVVRYDDDHQGGDEHAASGSAHSAEHPKAEVKVDLNGVELNAYANGLEQQIVTFLKGNGYANAADDAALKDKWYNFDNVNFKMGSSNQLEEGSDVQLQNLAKILKAYPDAKIKIGGYTDKKGDEAVNKKISAERANFIKSELGKLGVGAQIVSAEGYGSEFATVPADASDEERAKDRKMAVRFTK